MSFEGYYQRLCRNGHRMDCDAMMESMNDRCTECGERIAWWNLVDQTNDGGHPIKLKVKDEHTCNECGTTLNKTFHFPKEGRMV